MDTDIQIINPLKYPGWDELILSYDAYSSFHTSGWIKTINETYNYEPQFFAIKENDSFSSILPVMIVNSFLTGNRVLSLPFSDYCEPLIKEEADFKALFDKVLSFSKSKNMKYVEIRGGQKYLNKIAPSTIDYLHKLDLTQGKEKIYKNLSSNTKRNIKKAEREGVAVTISASNDAIEDFYQMNCATRKKHGLPPQPKKFFNNLYKNTLTEGKGFIVIAKHQNKSVASAFYLFTGKKALYKYGASYMEFQNLRANNIVMWEAIKRSMNDGYEEFCFGRTEPDNEGLRKFKLGWGTSEEVNNTYRYDLKKDSFVPLQTKTSGYHTKIFSNTPLPFLKLFGSLFYRHFG